MFGGPVCSPTTRSTTSLGVGALSCPDYRLAWRPVTQHQLDAPSLPPLAPPDASDDERARAIMARMVARYGAPTLDDYRRAYAGFGAEWPGDEEIRRRHIVAPDTAA
jgi:hypothetical protein